jgi:phosphoribosylglycinamide formyltransferase-1
MCALFKNKTAILQKDIMRKIAVFISGNGSNLVAIIDAIKTNALKNTSIELVVSSNKNALGAKKALENNIPVVISNNYDLITQKLKSVKIELIVLAGYTKILPNEFVCKWQNKIINIHPSLLPKYGGKGMYGLKVHESVLASNDKVTGATVHFVTNEIDKGKIILQKEISIGKTKNAKELQKKVLENVEWVIYPKAIEKVLSEN